MEKDKNMHRSTERVLDILQLVAEHPSQYTQTEISQKLEAPKSSLFPILYTLVARKFLEVDPDGRYGLGRSSWLLGTACFAGEEVLDGMEEVLQELTEETGEASHFAVLNRGNVLYLKKKDSPAFIRMTSRVGIQTPAYGTALGKALLLDHTMEQLQETYPEGLEELTPNTVKSISALYRQLQEARGEGITREVEESTPYIRCYAVPVRKNGAILGAISVAIPTFRYTEELGSRVKAQLSRAQSRAEQILQGADSTVFIEEAKRFV